MRNCRLVFLLNHPMQTAYCPQIGFKSKSRGRFKNNLNKTIFVQVFEQTRTATARFSLKSAQSIRIETSDPSKECRPINTIGGSNFGCRQSTVNGFNGTNPNFKGRVPSLVTLVHNQELNKTQTIRVNTKCCRFI